MRGTRIMLLLALLLVTASPATSRDYPSPGAIVVDEEGGRAWVAEEGTEQVTVLDLGRMQVGEKFATEGTPGGLALSADGAHLFVTLATPTGGVQEIELATGKTSRFLATGHMPGAIAAHPGGATLYVAERFTDTVAVLDLASGETRTRIPVAREPIALALTPDGAVLVVAHHLPRGAANGAYTGAEVTVIDTATDAVLASIALPNGSTGLRGLGLSPDGKHAYVTHILARYGLPTTQLDRGWVNTNAFSVIDLERRAWVATVLLDDLDRGAANPWGIECSSDGARLVVACSGTHELSVIDRVALHEKLARVAADPRTEVASDLIFLVDLRRRIALPGNGPRAVAFAGDRVLVGQHFTDDVAIVPLESSPGSAITTVALGTPLPQPPARRGERLFHDAEICFQTWQSCASCHPDGRADALNWDLINDGIGNPKNAKSLLLALDTPPAMITGVREDGASAVRAGLAFIHFQERPEEDAVAIEAYLRSLRPVPSPYLTPDGPSEAVRRGQWIFTTRCLECHPPPFYTDGKSHAFGDDAPAFDTPTLVEIWRTAPYLFDGRAADLRTAIAEHATDAVEGGGELKEEELDALVELLRTF